jgi:hypothetical protein
MKSPAVCCVVVLFAIRRRWPPVYGAPVLLRGSNPLGFGASLWVSDGTPAGTFRLTERGVGVRWERLFVAREGVLYFAACLQSARSPRASGGGLEPRLVKDVNPGPLDSDPT